MKYADKQSFDQANTFGTGDADMVLAEHFIGQSYLAPLYEPTDEVPMRLSNVSFEPGCRNDWHRHHAATGGGQVLICTAGEGWYHTVGRILSSWSRAPSSSSRPTPSTGTVPSQPRGSAT